MDDPLSIWDSRYAQKEKNTISSKYDYWMNRWEFLLQRQKRKIALDIGCGIGLDTKYLTEMGYTVISVDISGEALSICRQELPDNTFIQVNISEGLSFSKNSFQIINANLSLHYFSWEKTKNIVSNVHKCLKTGGLFLVRLNSTNDSNFGSVGHDEIEPNLFQVHGEQKRFFDITAVNKLFSSAWKSHSIEELRINRYSKPKIVWEIIAEKI